MDRFIDDVTSAFLTVLQGSGQRLGAYSLGILSVVAIIAYYREFGARVLQGQGSLSDALGAPLLYFLTVGAYYYGLIHLNAIGNAALSTFVQWALQGTGAGFDTAMLQQPSFIMEQGLKAARPIAEFDTWFNSIKSTFKLAAHPGDLVAYWFVLLAFMAITAHHLMMLIEFHLALMGAAVLLPWGLWAFTAPLAEFSLGWITGGLVRAFVGTTMLGVAFPLFALLNRPPAEEGFFTITQTVLLVLGSLLFAVLCYVIPARAAGIAGRGVSLALHGGTLMAPAATFARFSMMGTGIIRGFSTLVHALHTPRVATGRP
jgi:type IV secretory pathway TrbL component